jgi:hypothetical protein
MTIVVNGSGSTNLAYVAVQPWDYPFTFDVSGGTHTVTQANVTHQSLPTCGHFMDQ